MTEDELQSIRKEMIDKCNSLFKLGTIRINSYDYNIFFGTSSLYLHKDVCFARADDRVAEKYNNNYSTFYYVLRPYSELYDAGLVIDSLRRIFEETLTINIIEIQDKNVLLIEFLDKVTLPQGVYLDLMVTIGVILRFIDTEFTYGFREKRAKYESPKTPYSNIVELITFMQQTYLTSYGHDMNDNLVNLSKDSTKKYLPRYIRGYFNVLEYLFKNPNTKLIDKFGKRLPYGSFLGQTQHYSRLFKLSTQIREETT